MKITIKVTNGTAPLDQIYFTGERIQQVEIEDINDYNQIIDLATKFVLTINGADKTTVKVRVLSSNGSMIFDGAFSNGRFVNGIISS